MFTYHYQQPDEYRFSLDSIQFAEFVAKDIETRSDLPTMRILDLCAGCGVIGLQMSWFLRDIRQLDFMEVQDVYAQYFEKNVVTVNRPELQCRWHQANYDILLTEEWRHKYDLIISNPPYFHPGHGVYSPSEFKNRCRFFLDSTFENYILGMANALDKNGKAYFLLRPLPQHGYHLLDDIKYLLKDKNISINNITTIRGTDVILLQK